MAAKNKTEQKPIPLLAPIPATRHIADVRVAKLLQHRQWQHEQPQAFLKEEAKRATNNLTNAKAKAKEKSKINVTSLDLHRTNTKHRQDHNEQYTTTHLDFLEAWVGAQQLVNVDEM